MLGYAKIIYIESHLGPDIHEDTAMGITAGLILLSCGLAIGLSKVAPRRLLLLSSAISCSLTLSLLGLYYYLKAAGFHVANFAWTPLVALLSLIVSYMCGYGAVAWTVIVELLPGRVRSQTFPLVVAFNCIAHFGFALSFPYVENLAGYHVVFWIFAALTALGVVVVALCVPETRDRTEEEIAAFFRGDNGCCCDCDVCRAGACLSESCCCSVASTAGSLPSSSSILAENHSSLYTIAETVSEDSYSLDSSNLDVVRCTSSYTKNSNQSETTHSTGLSDSSLDSSNLDVSRCTSSRKGLSDSNHSMSHVNSDDASDKCVENSSNISNLEHYPIE